MLRVCPQDAVVINSVFDGMKEDRCAHCDLLGHRASHCWFNLALYDNCRRKDQL